ncbi:MAG: dienelactone hydrolase family protein [Actinomycetota bacterium]
MDRQDVEVAVDGGAVPVIVLATDDPATRPALLCVPSIFGANDDLVDQLASLTDVATTAVMDPFWTVSPGPIPYADRKAAFERAGALDRSRTPGDVAAVARWLADRSNGRVAGLGICFGGPPVLLGMSAGALAGVVTWHGSRMEGVLDRLDVTAMTGPLRFHFGDADPITPPDAIGAVAAAFAANGDCAIVVHPGADHGFSHEGDAWDAEATAAGMADLRAVLEQLAG